MCIVATSESGHGGRFEPCEEYKRLLQRSSELTGNLDNKVELLEAENAALRKYRDRLAGIVEKADALAEVASCYPTSGGDSDLRQTVKAYQEARHG